MEERDDEFDDEGEPAEVSLFAEVVADCGVEDSPRDDEGWDSPLGDADSMSAESDDFDSDNALPSVEVAFWLSSPIFGDCPAPKGFSETSGTFWELFAGSPFEADPSPWESPSTEDRDSPNGPLDADVLEFASLEFDGVALGGEDESNGASD